MITKDQKDYIIKLLQEGKELPQDFKYQLFPTTQKEYELIYAWKMRKEDILANEDGIFPVPLQVEKIFNGNEHKAFADDRKNMIVFWDNLQFLKTIYENKDPLIKDKLKGKIKLIYIDPPFATTDEFKNKEGAKAYNDKKKGAEFVEFLRKRLIVAREILHDNGCIFVHLDQKMSHYIKILMDEIFGKQNFRNEIIRHYTGNSVPVKCFPRKHDIIYLYSKTENLKFNFDTVLESYSDLTLKRYNHVDEDGRKYKVSALRNGEQEIVYAKEWKYPDDVWDIPVPRSKNEIIGYPTQKPEDLLNKIIKSTTNKDDIVLDFFGWSGTTMTVAEKLDRKWVSCDLGKLSYFTMQKRILKIQDSKNLKNPKKTHNKKAKSFMTCSLGLYDLKKALDLEWSKYLEFVSGLFEIELKKHKISGFEFEGKKNNYSVKIWDYNKYKDANVDEAYLNNIHQTIGGKVSWRIYIIAPANNIDFLTDYHEIDGLRYYFLKIPYQVIRELHKIPFQKLKQPQSKKNVNDLDETIGFHFIKAPEVKSEIKKSGDDIKITIKEFRSQYYKDEEGSILDNFESLSAVFIDKNFDGNQFIMTDSFFADDLLPKKKTKKNEDDENNADDEDIRKDLKEIKNKGLVISLKKKEVGKKIMIIYTDIYWNDFTEILTA